MSNVNLVATILAVYAGALLLYSECIYMWSIISRKSDPNPVSWGIWTVGAIVLFGIELKTGFTINALYLGVFAISTAAIFLLSATVGIGKSLIGTLEIFCAFVALFGIACWYWWDLPIVAFLSSIVVDASGVFVMCRYAAKYPENEPLMPWQITFVSTIVNFTSVSIFYVIGEKDAYALTFSIYFIIANYLVLVQLLRHARTWSLIDYVNWKLITRPD